MLTDEVKIKVIAGRGGDGIVAFDKVKMSLGPTGGRGGNGGDVYFEGVSDIFALNKYRHKREYWAENGRTGRGNRSDGPAGKDLVLTVPSGTVLKNLETREETEVLEPGQKILAAKGGYGGRGNFSFRSPTNTSPQEFEEGKPGEEFEFVLELRLIAQIGLIGFPNAGKSSLLNELTKANARIGSYEFTTLEPNLGSLEGIIIADIPGLIEGASTGRGLGIKFLRHIRRTEVLVHCLSSESPDPARDYKIIRKELADYDPELTAKKEIVLITKSDLAKNGSPDKIKKILTKLNPDVMAVSIHDWDSLESLKNKFTSLLHK